MHDYYDTVRNFIDINREAEAQAEALVVAEGWALQNVKSPDPQTIRRDLGGGCASVLERLPAEIRDLILERLDMLELISCFLTRRAWQALAIPHLRRKTFYLHGTVEQIDSTFHRLDTVLQHRVSMQCLSICIQSNQDEESATQWQDSLFLKSIDVQNLKTLYLRADISDTDMLLWDKFAQGKKYKVFKFSNDHMNTTPGPPPPRSLKLTLDKKPMKSCKLDVLEVVAHGDFEVDPAFTSLADGARCIRVHLTEYWNQRGITEAVLAAKDTLEELSLYRLEIKIAKGGVMPVTFPKLRSLKLRGTDMSKWKIHAPALQHLRVERGSRGRMVSTQFLRQCMSGLETLHIDVTPRETLHLFTQELIYHLQICTRLTIQFDEPNLNQVGDEDPKEAIDPEPIWTVLCQEDCKILPKLDEIVFHSERTRIGRPLLRDEELISFIEAREKAGLNPLALTIGNINWPDVKEETLELLKGKVSRLSRLKPSGKTVYV